MENSGLLQSIAQKQQLPSALAWVWEKQYSAIYVDKIWSWIVYQPFMSLIFIFNLGWHWWVLWKQKETIHIETSWSSFAMKDLYSKKSKLRRLQCDNCMRPAIKAACPKKGQLWLHLWKKYAGHWLQFWNTNFGFLLSSHMLACAWRSSLLLRCKGSSKGKSKGKRPPSRLPGGLLACWLGSIKWSFNIFLLDLGQWNLLPKGAQHARALTFSWVNIFILVPKGVGFVLRMSILQMHLLCLWKQCSQWYQKQDTSTTVCLIRAQPISEQKAPQDAREKGPLQSPKSFA